VLQREPEMSAWMAAICSATLPGVLPLDLERAEHPEARGRLQRALELRRRIGHPDVAETEAALARVVDPAP